MGRKESNQTKSKKFDVPKGIQDIEIGLFVIHSYTIELKDGLLITINNR